jgi:hypothetical protein
MQASTNCLWTLCLLVWASSLGAQDFGRDVDDFPVIPAQLLESIPSPLDEAAPLGGPPQAANPANPTQLAPSRMETPSTSSSLNPTTEMPSVGEFTYDGDLGQPYDMHLADNILHADAEVHSTSNWFRGGQWYSQQEFVLILRMNLPAVHVATDLTRPAGGSIFIDGSLSTKDADFTFEPGTRLTLGRTLGRDVANRDHALELTFFGLLSYEGQAAIQRSDPNLFVSGPGGFPVEVGIETLLGTNEAFFDRAGAFGFPSGINEVPGFSNADAQNIDYRADFNSFELNYRIGARPSRDRLIMQPNGRWLRHATPSNINALFMGMRYIKQNELFQYTSVGGQIPGERGFYEVKTRNDLIGVQFGGEITEKRTDWVVGLRGKLGGLLNLAERDSLVDAVGDVDGNGFLENINRNQSLSDEYLAFLGEAGIYFAYFLRPNTSLRVGYDAMLINGLATATNNIGLFPEFPKFEVTGNSLYMGLNVGFEMTW